ncbi:TlpA family protein disulfide reductase [Mycolicibacterium palauense]|uniref:TlpA family protein disulfide reductase n=1 Tax=Mycolicibacterium palauense TaxID=2034511 RepID=UPI000BFF09F5|nr:TlpA disulfide reductase family protein [Mycolicibacterium palauense]
MSSSTRWTVAVLAFAGVLVAAFAVQLAGGPDERRAGTGTTTPSAPSASALPDDPGAGAAAQLRDLRARADLRPCPTGSGAPGPPALRGVVVGCAADGAEVDVAPALAGRAVVLNLWAYWCAPCAEELPAMAEYQRRMGEAVSVVTVHQDDDEAAALARLAELGVHLPTLQDGRRRIAAALKVPNVMPATVVLRADGSVAQILPRAFVSADEIADAVGDSIR